MTDRGVGTRAGDRLHAATVVLLAFAPAAALDADSPFAAHVLSFDPAPGQFVNDPGFDDPSRALGAPIGGGLAAADLSSLVSLGAFGGSITLGFDHLVRNDPVNPFGLDFIVYGNALWVGGDPNRKWAECAHVEISRDVNSNGLADDPWYLIPGSHIADVQSQFLVQTWDDDIADATHPPANPTWIPPGRSGIWTTAAFRLPDDVFGSLVLENPDGPQATTEAVYGYADLSPTVRLGDTNADDEVDDPAARPEAFYVVPDDPFTVGVTPGSGGGDGFDIGWAIDPQTGLAAPLDGFDFLRVTTAAHALDGLLGETSAEIDAAADVAAGRMGDVDGNGVVDWSDHGWFARCLAGPTAQVPGSPCSVVDFDGDLDVDVRDWAEFQLVFLTAGDR